MRFFICLAAISLSFPAIAEESCYSARENRNVECVNFVAQDLSGGDYTGADWAGGNFERANMSYTVLDHAYLMEANFKETNLAYSSLYGAQLYGTDLRNADLTGANLNGTNLVAADLRDIKYSDETTFNGSSFNRQTRFPKEWGKTWDEAYWEAVRRGMLPIRE